MHRKILLFPLFLLAFALASLHASAQGLPSLGSSTDSSKAQKKDSASAILPDTTMPQLVDPTISRQYRIAGVDVFGTRFLDKQVLIIIAGLKVGDMLDVPGEGLAKAVNNLWKQGLFGDVKVYVTKVVGNDIYIAFALQEKPRLTRYEFTKGSIKKNDREDLEKKLNLQRGRVLTSTLKANVIASIRNFYIDKGYWDVNVTLAELPDTVEANGVQVAITIRKGRKVKIQKISIEGNTAISDAKLKHSLKNTKERHFYNIFKGSKYIEQKYQADKDLLIKAYQEKGYRDAKVLSDTVLKVKPARLAIQINLQEGNRYYFRNITWVGNTLHTDEELNNILGIKRGDIYNQQTLESRLFIDQAGRDVSSLYMDDGYLFFQVTPVEVNVEGDSIDLEIRLYEGQQAIVNKVTVIGNTKTSDRVVLREVRTRPGQKFSRADILRTQRELQQLGYFDPEQMGVTPRPNQADGTVDIEYKVAERSNDQVELSGGWGAGRIVGSLGLTLNNFSARKFLKANQWRPVPSGDGQRLSLRAQSTGVTFQSYNASFTEPWLGGKKPNSFTVSAYYSVQNYNFLGSNNITQQQYISVLGTSVSLGKRLKWPDDYFTLLHSINYQKYLVRNYSILDNGQYNNLYIKETFARNSIDQPIFPRSGSLFSLSVQFTPPYSAINGKNYSTLDAAEKYKFTEYHKWRFDASWYTRIVGNFVLNTRINMGFLGTYNSEAGTPPFGRFVMGGDGITGFQLDDRELIGLRGYQNNSLAFSGGKNGAQIGGTAFHKYVFELRYPITLNPSATVWVQTFMEAGNNFLKVKDFNAFDMKRSVGVGVRVFLPMFGLLGVDYGYGLDIVPASPKRGNLHVSIGQQF